MGIPDITGLSKEELRELITAASDAYSAAEAAEKESVATRKSAIAAAVSALTSLLGPVEGDPGTDSIRAVRRFDEQTMADNAGVAFGLAFNGLEQVTATVLDIAKVLSSDS